MKYFNRMKIYLVFALVFGTIFLTMIAYRAGVFHGIMSEDATEMLKTVKGEFERDNWMQIIQNGKKIGYSHSVFEKTDNGYILNERLFMRINTMGKVQDINMRSKGWLKDDYTLSKFDFKIGSGLFVFEALGSVEDNILTVKTKSMDDEREFSMKLENKPFLAGGIIDAVRMLGMEKGEKYKFNIFDPASMASQTVFVDVDGYEDIMIDGEMTVTTRLVMKFRDIEQFAWVGEDGSIVKQVGMLGISFEKTNKADALFSPGIRASDDLTQVASVESNMELANPEQLSSMTVKLRGIYRAKLKLYETRQIYRGYSEILINKEDISKLRDGPLILDRVNKKLLAPAMFIQSDHPDIISMVEKITSKDDSHLAKAKKIINWIYENIEKKPVLSVPDALSTLKNRVGDCNEHAMLLAAMARAAGIPADVEAGIVYLKGRFYYHAWNRLYLGTWVTADSALGQFPADVTHVRLITGAEKLQFDLMSVIGNLKLNIESVK